MKITNFKDKTYNRFYELLTEDDPHPQSPQPIGHLEDTNQRTILS